MFTCCFSDIYCVCFFLGNYYKILQYNDPQKLVSLVQVDQNNLNLRKIQWQDSKDENINKLVMGVEILTTAILKNSKWLLNL